MSLPSARRRKRSLFNTKGQLWTSTATPNMSTTRQKKAKRFFAGLTLSFSLSCVAAISSRALPRGVWVDLIDSFLDKTLLNYSSIFGLLEDLHLQGQDYSWAGRSVPPIDVVLREQYLLLRLHAWERRVVQARAAISTTCWGKIISGAVFIWSSIILLTREAPHSPHDLCS